MGTIQLWGPGSDPLTSDAEGMLSIHGTILGVEGAWTTHLPPVKWNSGQKWNSWLLKCYKPPGATWTEKRIPDPEGNGLALEDTDHLVLVTVLQSLHWYPDREQKLPD